MQRDGLSSRVHRICRGDLQGNHSWRVLYGLDLQADKAGGKFVGKQNQAAVKNEAREGIIKV